MKPLEILFVVDHDGHTFTATRTDLWSHFVLSIDAPGTEERPRGWNLAEVICRREMVISFSGNCPLDTFSRLLAAGGEDVNGDRGLDPGPTVLADDDDDDDDIAASVTLVSGDAR